jgi:hypothetical protein
MRLRNIGPNKHTIFCPINATDPYLYDVARTEGYFTFFGEEFCYEGSPWVAQDVVFPLHADILLHKAFCRLASRKNRKTKKERHVYEEHLYQVDLVGTGRYPEPCLDGAKRGIEKQTLGLEQIRQMWDSYHDIPKFAYLNAMAAHRYVQIWSSFPINAEAYDEHLSDMLESFLQRADANETIIIVRSDHGFQGSDMMPVDYSTQIEHARPWTEIIVPDRYPVDKLFANRDKAVTSYDLYRTIRDLMSSSSDQYGLDWAHNILTEDVPSQRTCQQARIPRDFCLANAPPPPTFGTCNMFEATQALFCLDPTAGADVGPTPCGVNATNEALRAYRDSTQRWSELDAVVATHRDIAKVSGGIFLYPRQSFILTSILRKLVSERIKGDTQKLRVCETGFGAGHSAALFLSAFEHEVEVITFDKFNRKYQIPALEKLRNRLPNIRHVVGDSCKSVPAFFANETERPCDLVHGSSFCRSDMIDLVRHMRPGGIVTATAMPTLNEESVYFGKRAQWRKLRNQGCIANIRCWKEEPLELTDSFVFAGKGTIMEHAFCVATSTGNCTSPDKGYQGRSRSEINLDDICSASSRVEVPV